ncbi:MAG: hypothetical protein LBD97_08310 [Bifidobacteriaceae bacterium]|nr:hypothetical protein [Bifidobacteriaceae bacterium]
MFESTRLEPATPRLLHLLAARGFRLLTPAPGLARDRIAWRMVGPVTCALPVQAPNPPAASEGLAPDSASASDGAAAPDGVAASAGPDAPDGAAALAGPDAPDGVAASAGPDAPDLPAPRNSPAPHRVLTPNFDAAGPTAVAGPQVGPTALGECQLVLVPALAVDRSGTRLGRGGGWYDRALAHAAPEALVLGVCFPSELLPAGTLPHEPHDLPVHGALTSEGVVLF